MKFEWIVIAALVALVAYLWWRRRREKSSASDELTTSPPATSGNVQVDAAARGAADVDVRPLRPDRINVNLDLLE